MAKKTYFIEELKAEGKTGDSTPVTFPKADKGVVKHYTHITYTNFDSTVAYCVIGRRKDGKDRFIAKAQSTIANLPYLFDTPDIIILGGSQLIAYFIADSTDDDILLYASGYITQEEN